MNSEQLKALEEIVAYLLQEEMEFLKNGKTEKHLPIHSQIVILNDFIWSRKNKEIRIKQILYTIKPEDLKDGCKRQEEELKKLFKLAWK